MMRATRTLLVCLAIPACANACAQATGTLRILCEPQGTCEYILDGKHRLRDRELTLFEGPHRLVFWAPERRMLDTTLMVAPNTTNEARIQLRYSEEFIAYNRRLRRHQRDDRWWRYGTPVLAVGAATWLGVSAWKAFDAQRDIDALEQAYGESDSPARIAEIKRVDIPDANQRLREARTLAWVSGGITVAAGAAWWYLRKMRANRQPPVFEDKEKARFEGLVWAPGPNGQGVWLAGLAIPLP